MSLGLRELRRAWGRFVLLAGSVALLMFLILFQQSIQDGLITAFIGAVRNQTRAGGRLQPGRSTNSPSELPDSRSGR